MTNRTAVVSGHETEGALGCYSVPCFDTWAAAFIVEEKLSGVDLGCAGQTPGVARRLHRSGQLCLGWGGGSRGGY